MTYIYIYINSLICKRNLKTGILGGSSHKSKVLGITEVIDGITRETASGLLFFPGEMADRIKSPRFNGRNRSGCIMTGRMTFNAI